MAVWKTQHALDVGGSVKASSIVAGGTTSKQIDCGTITITHGSHVSFNFTFVNVPNVCVNLIGNWGATTVCYINTYNINNTGFYVSSAHLDGAFPIISMASANITWVAIG